MVLPKADSWRPRKYHREVSATIALREQAVASKCQKKLRDSCSGTENKPLRGFVSQEDSRLSACRQRYVPVLKIQARSTVQQMPQLNDFIEGS